MSRVSIDLNADLGEGYACDRELLKLVSSCNVACGGHAGDAASMRTTVRLARENAVSVGAHPAYPDKEGFGRRSGFLAGDALLASLRAQIEALASVAAEQNVSLTHVKPHGALYNDAVCNRALADIVAAAICAAQPGAAYVGLPMSEMQQAALDHGLDFIAEGFIDRAYQDDGQLVSRDKPGAVHKSLDLVLPQAVALVGKVDTLCIHGDTPGAVEAATAVRAELEQRGIAIRAFCR